jgi:hypothetical protein
MKRAFIAKLGPGRFVLAQYFIQPGLGCPLETVQTACRDIMGRWRRLKLFKIKDLVDPIRRGEFP